VVKALSALEAADKPCVRRRLKLELEGLGREGLGREGLGREGLGLSDSLDSLLDPLLETFPNADDADDAAFERCFDRTIYKKIKKFF
tara:strand:+ start:858 stop:1118 length:261 start_codon:yes stop_codon:yes gene_type:complete